MEDKQKQALENLFDDIPNVKKKITDTFAHIFRKDYRENFISDWVAFLIDPEKTGTLEILNSLLLVAECEKTVPEGTSILIEREYTFKSGNRIDFYIETEDEVIGIENKIWSEVRSNQLERYLNDLKEIAADKDKGCALLLLYPKSNENVDVSTLDDVYYATYEDFVEKLKKIRINMMENIRAAVLLQDFITHMEEYIMTSEKNQIDFNLVKYFFDKQEEIKEIKNLEKDHIDRFKKVVCTEINMDSDEWETPWASTNGAYFQLFKKTWPDGVHFELLRKEGESYLPKKYSLEFHVENKKNKSELKDFKQKFESKKYEINYENEEKYSASIKEMTKALKKVAEENKNEIDRLLKDL